MSATIIADVTNLSMSSSTARCNYCGAHLHIGSGSFNMLFYWHFVKLLVFSTHITTCTFMTNENSLKLQIVTTALPLCVILQLKLLYTLPHSTRKPLVCQFRCSISECNKRIVTQPICNANVCATSGGCYI